MATRERCNGTIDGGHDAQILELGAQTDCGP